MKNSVFRLVFPVFFGSVGEAMAQPVADYFQPPVWPIDQSRTDENGYYNANLFLQNTPGRGYHSGEDWNGNEGKSTDYGDPVYPIAVGQVVKVFDPVQKHSWGKTVLLKHRLPDDQIVYSLYAHLSRILVTQNQIVETNQLVGEIGDANGYYAGAAHLHLELRRVNDWTPASPGYYSTLTVAAARKYLDPSLFLDDRMDWWWTQRAAGTIRASNEEIEISNYAPASLTYISCGKSETVLSLPLAIEAGWVSPTVYFRAPGAYWWRAAELKDFIFRPGDDFEIELLDYCFLAINIPGHNFQSSRARDDMILAAEKAGFTRVRLETFTDLFVGSSALFDFRFLCFDRGTGTGAACTIHATYRDNPLYRWILWYEPATKEYLGDWTALSPLIQ